MSVDLTVPLMVSVGAGAFLIGLSKGGLGGGLGPLITILIALFVPPSRAIGILLPLLMAGDVFAVWAHRRTWSRALIVRLLPAAAVGVAIASVFLGSVSERGLEIFLGVFSIVFVLYRVAEQRVRAFDLRPGTGAGIVAGFTSGVTSTVAHAGGPPVVVYLLASRTPPVTYVATTAVFFAIVNWLKVPGYMAAGLLDASLIARLAPLALLTIPGVFVGRMLVERVSRALFDRLVVGLLLVGAVYLLVP